MNVLKKYKKPLLIITMLMLYVIFWWWFFGEKDVAIQEPLMKESKEEITREVVDIESSTVSDDGRQFTEFGNFWMQINTKKVSLKAPIVEGVMPKDLNQGIGHHRTTASPSRESGNVVLSGHRWKFGKNPAYKIFENIDKLEIGDMVTLYYYGNEFVYKITEQKTVDDKSIDILEQSDESILTFYTCTPKYTAFRRLVYRAVLVD